MNPQDPYQQQNPSQPSQPQYGQPQQPYGQPGPQYQQPSGQPQYPPQPMTPPTPPPTPRAAILWFCSPAIAIGLALIFGILSRVFLYSETLVRIINILDILCGMAFVILIVLGPVMGVLTISKHKK